MRESLTAQAQTVSLWSRVRPRAPRNVEFGSLLETFLIAGITTVLVIRTQLWLTHYPQLGGAGLHIAHLLWGGVFMVVAIGILLVFLGRGPRRPAAVVGGVGFGFFIDEVGKFITEDNDYFFKPAAGVIYLIFILLFLLIRQLARGPGLSSAERAANAVYLAIDATHGRLRERERERAVALLAQADTTDPLVVPLRNLVAELRGVPTPPPRFYERWAESARSLYLRATRWQGFGSLITTVFVLWASAELSIVLTMVYSFGVEVGVARAGYASDELADLNFLNVATTICYAASTTCVVLGLVRVRRDRLSAYRWFERALLVSLLLTHVFIFVESQFGAVFGVGLDILLLLAVRSMIHVEQGRPDEIPVLIDHSSIGSPAQAPLAAPDTPPP
jgi:hypothetical protein